MEVPKVLYHATFRKNLVTIMGEGINTGIDGYVYTTDKPDTSAFFLAIRNTNNEDIVSVAIDTSKLNKESFGYGTDHSTEFFKCEVYTYSEKIQYEALIVEKSRIYEMSKVQ